MPQQVIDALVYVPSEGGTKGGVITNETLERMLGCLPVKEYESHELWLGIMLAAHHATDAQGVDEFVDWSLQDENYMDQESVIRQRWDSLCVDSGNSQITYKSLLHELGKHGADLTQFQLNHDDDFTGIADLPADKPADPVAVQNLENVITQQNDPIAAANRLMPTMSYDEQTEIIRFVNNSKNKIAKIKAIAIIQQRLELTKSELNRIIKELQLESDEDMGNAIAQITLNADYGEGNHLMFVEGGYWFYQGLYWKPVGDKAIRRNLLGHAAVVIEERESGLDLDVATKKAEYIVAGTVATDDDVFKRSKEPLPIVNCTNGELWINADGTHELKPHDPKSFLTSSIATEYNPDAVCPTWDRIIKEIFESDTPGQAEDMVSAI